MVLLGFDLEHTLTDPSCPSSYTILRKLCGIEPELYERLVIREKGDIEDYRKMENELIRERAKENNVDLEMFLEEAKKIKLRKGAKKFLEKISKKADIFLLTTSMRPYAETVIRRLNCKMEVFCGEAIIEKGIIVGYYVPFKNKKEAMQRIMTRFKKKRNETGYVGDGINDRPAWEEVYMSIHIGEKRREDVLISVKTYSELEKNKDFLAWMRGT